MQISTLLVESKSNHDSYSVFDFISKIARLGTIFIEKIGAACYFMQISMNSKQPVQIHLDTMKLGNLYTSFTVSVLVTITVHTIFLYHVCIKS